MRRTGSSIRRVDEELPSVVVRPMLPDESVVELNPQYTDGGRLSTVTVLVERNANDERIYEVLARIFRARIIERVRLAGLNPNAVRGLLSVENRTNGVAITHENVISITGLTEEHLLDILDQITTSNNDAELLDLVWIFHLSGTVAGRTRIPKWWPKACYQILWNTPDNINCMIYSLVYMKWNTQKRFTARPHLVRLALI